MMDLKVGDRIWRWWYCGANEAEIQPLTVVRVNRVTVTVRTDQGSTFRLPVSEVAGPVDWDESPIATSCPDRHLAG